MTPKEYLEKNGLGDAWSIYERLNPVQGSVEKFWSQPKQERTIENVVHHLVRFGTLTDGQVRLLHVQLRQIKARSK